MRNYVIIGIGQTLLFVALLNGRNWWGRGDVLFVDGLLLLLLAVVFVVWWGVNKLRPWQRVVEISIVIGCINLVLFVLFPITFDRSVTMHLLHKIESVDKISSHELLEDLEKVYIEEEGAVDKRIVEQQQIDFVKIDRGNIELTLNGRLFLKFADVVAKIYGIQK